MNIIQKEIIYVYGFIVSMANPEKVYDPKAIVGEIKKFGVTHIAMTDNLLRPRLKQVILSSEEINIIYNGKNMIVEFLK